MGKNETITTPRLSFRFLNVSPAVERELQRIIFRLSARPEKERIKCENNLHAKLHGVQRLLKLPDIAVPAARDDYQQHVQKTRPHPDR